MWVEETKPVETALEQQRNKKQYQTPHLIRFGTVTELTQLDIVAGPSQLR